MRLVVISTEFPPGPGGVGIHSWELAKNLSLQGIEIKVIEAGKKAKLREKAEQAQLEHQNEVIDDE